MADVLSSTSPSFFMGLVFVLQGLVDSRLAGGHCHDIGLSFGLFFFFLVGGGGRWPLVPLSLVAAVLSLIPRNLFLGMVTSGDSF